MAHPRDEEEGKEHPQQHEHQWTSVTNGWGDVIGWECTDLTCNAYKSA